MRAPRLFTQHPQSVGETYGQHLATAGDFGLRMIAGGLACLVHALLPFLFVRTGSLTIANLNARMARRHEGIHGPDLRDEPYAGALTRKTAISQLNGPMAGR